MSTSSVIPIRDGVAVPDFITRVDISMMNDTQLDELIEAIKTRRMSSFIVYQQTVADKASADEDKAKIKLEKKLEMVLKTLIAVDKQLEKLETQINEVRGLRIQAGLSII